MLASRMSPTVFCSKFDTFVGAVINQRSFDKISAYIDRAKASDQAQVIAGGNCDDSRGFYIEPTVIEVLIDLYMKLQA